MFSGMRKGMNNGEEMSYEVNPNVHLTFALMLIIAPTPGCHMSDITHSESNYGWSLPPWVACQIRSFNIPISSLLVQIILLLLDISPLL